MSGIPDCTVSSRFPLSDDGGDRGAAELRGRGQEEGAQAPEQTILYDFTNLKNFAPALV